MTFSISHEERDIYGEGRRNSSVLSQNQKTTQQWSYAWEPGERMTALVVLVELAETDTKDQNLG